MTDELATDIPIPTFDQSPAATSLRFTGSGDEYFKIWVVNLTLTLLTLGVYSAWAKVRRLQYFYRHTELDGTAFDYTAKPLAILRGRLIALMLFVAYVAAFEYSPHAGLAITLVVMGALPFLLWQSNRFKARNTRYRGLTFGFQGTVRDAYIAYVPVLIVVLGPSAVAAYYLGPNSVWWTGLLSIGALATMPIFHALFRRYIQRSLQYGQSAFVFQAGARDFVELWVMALIWTVVAGVTGMIGGAVVGGVLYVIGKVAGFSIQFPIIFGVLMVWLTILLLTGFFSARYQDLIWGNTSLGIVKVVSKTSSWRLTKIHLTNTFGVILSLGTYRPFAAIRLARYRLECVSVLGVEGLNTFLAAERVSGRGATGEGTAEMFDVDAGL